MFWLLFYQVVTVSISLLIFGLWQIKITLQCRRLLRQKDFYHSKFESDKRYTTLSLMMIAFFEKGLENL